MPRRELRLDGSAIAQLARVRPRLRAIGLAAMTLVTVGGLARRARRRSRPHRPGPPVPPLASRPRRMRGPQFSAGDHEFLSEASALLASSLDYEETLKRAATLGASRPADWCLLYLQDPDGTTGGIAVAHAEDALAPLAARLEALAAPGPVPAVVQRAIDTRQPGLVPSVPPEIVVALASSPEHLEVLKQLQVESLLVVPLVVRGRALGAMMRVAATPWRRFGGAAIPLACELGRRTAVAIANAMQYRDAMAAVAARDEILAVVAHDLRSPLHVIEFAAERLRQEAPGPRRRTTDRSLDWIVSSTQRATSLVRDLLERARFEWRSAGLVFSPVDPIDLVREVARRAEALGALASVRVAEDLPAHLPPVRGDRARLLQALENIVGNAIKFTPEHGSVTIGALEAKEAVRFSVRDTGGGIAPEDLERMFERFWQARGADARGAGLGLSICKRIIEAHGGRVWAESQVGVGTTVSFTIGLAT